MSENLITFQDPDGSIRRKLDALIKQEREQYPERQVSMSALIRELLNYAFGVYKAPRLEDKLSPGKLRK